MKVFLIHQSKSNRDIREIVERFNPIIVEPLPARSEQQSLNDTVSMLWDKNEMPITIIEDDLVFEDFITLDFLKEKQKQYQSYDTIKFTTMKGNLGTQLVIYNNITPSMKTQMYDIDLLGPDVKTKILPFTKQR